MNVLFMDVDGNSELLSVNTDLIRQSGIVTRKGKTFAYVGMNKAFDELRFAETKSLDLSDHPIYTPDL